MPFAIDGLRSHFTMLLFLYEEMDTFLYQGQERIHWGSFTLHLDPSKQVYHNKSLDELDVQQCTISTCYYHFFIIT